jgi:hypothetical protein
LESKKLYYRTVRDYPFDDRTARYYHEIQPSGLCLHCEAWCPNCNQCKCEIGRRKRCPNFDTKKNSVAFQSFLHQLKIRAEFFEAKGYFLKTGREFLLNQWYYNYMPGVAFADYYARRDKDGLAYYDR